MTQICHFEMQSRHLGREAFVLKRFAIKSSMKKLLLVLIM